jgi:hypothetical protein
MRPEWWDLPLDPASRDAEIAALVAERRADASPEQQRLIVSLLSRTASAAAELGAGLCAECAATDDEGHLMGANLLVTEAPVPLPEDLQRPVSEIVGRGFPDQDDPPPAECSVVLLPQAGPAIRVRSDPRPPSPDEPRDGLNSLRLQFLVPVPGWDTTAVVTFSSPVLTGDEPEDLLVELFDDMADTFCFVDAEGEPIPPDGRL